MSKTVNAILVKLADNSEEISECTISYQFPSPGVIEFQNTYLGRHYFEDVDLFECLCKLRIFLERQGLKILCNGARIDAYPSPMSRDMSGGLKLYRLKMGERSKRSDLLRIFDRAEPSQVGTVDEQLTYYQNWLKSVS